MQDKRLILTHQLTAALVEIKNDFKRGLKPIHDWTQIVGSSETEPLNQKGLLPELKTACKQEKDGTSVLILSIIAPLSEIENPPQKSDLETINQVIDGLRELAPSKKHNHRKSA